MIERNKPRGLRGWCWHLVTRGGFNGAFRLEAAFRQEVALALVVVPLGLWLGKTGIEKALLVAPCCWC